jgi:ChrR Cupin-like domain
MNVEDNCFCDLAPLYALDLLAEGDQAKVEAILADAPELAVELGEFQAAAAAIAYSAPAIPMANDLKARLFQQLAVDLPATSPAETSSESNWVGFVVTAADLVWRPHPTPGVRIAIMHRDRAKREVVGILQAEPGVRYPWHRHAATEELYMLEGDLCIAGKTYGKGAYIFSAPGSAHAPTTQTGCKFFFRTSMDDEYPDQPSA